MIESHYKLPEGWRWVRLGEIASLIKAGFAFRKNGVADGDLLHLRPYNIGKDGTLDLSQRFFVPRNSMPANEMILQPGDVLFNNTNSVELVGKTALVREMIEATFSNHITLIRTDVQICEGPWLAIVLRVLWQKGFFAEKCNKWIGQAGVNSETLKEIEVPLPPLTEQQRIVARIEELMARVREARQLREEVKGDIDRLAQAALAEVFPRPGTELPPGWRWVRLGEVSEILMGQSPPSSTYNWEGRGLPFFQGKADFGELYPEPRTWCSSPRTVAQPGDVLISVRAPVGPTNVARQPSCVGRGLAVLRPMHNIESLWLLYYVRSIQARLTSLGKGSAFRGIRKKDLQEIQCPLAPLAQQREIIAYLDNVRQQLKRLKEAQFTTETEFNRLERAILDKALGGEL